MKINSNKLIPISKPQIGRAERLAVSRVMKSGQIAQGSEVLEFEKEFSVYVDQRACVAVNSGTSALHIALLSLGIGAGDEVIVPSFTFAATANSVVLAGAKPVFVDVQSDTFCIDPTEIENAITVHTKAIVVVHLYGLPSDMLKILDIAAQHNLKVIEDAAQAHLAEIRGQRVGTFGDAAAFSFYPTKNMTSGEGGMVAFKEDASARTARLLRNQGMEKRYENEIVGFNLRMNNIQAAIGRVQLRKLPERNEKRQENAFLLNQRLSGLVRIPFIPDGYTHVFHQYTIQVEGERQRYVDFLREHSIETGIYYPTPVHKLKPFSRNITLPITDSLSQKALSLPVHPSLKRKDLIRVASAVSKACQRS